MLDADADPAIDGSADTLRISDTRHDFGFLMVAGSADFAATVTNTGSAPTGAIGVTSTDTNGHFEVLASSTCGPPLQAAESCELRLRFHPQLAGPKTATITASALPGGQVRVLLDGVANGVIQVDKRGTGTGVVQSNPAGINCGAVCSATFAVPSVTLNATANPGNQIDSSGTCGSSTSCTIDLSAASRTVVFSFSPM